MEWLNYEWLVNLLATATAAYSLFIAFHCILRPKIQARALGFQLLLFCFVQIVLLSAQTIGLTISMQAIMALLFLLGPLVLFYIKSFFGLQANRVLGHLIVFILVVNAIAYSLISFNTIAYLAASHIFIYLIFGIRIVRIETRSRGIQLFDNPGSRLVWFRNYIGMQTAIYGYVIYQLLNNHNFYSGTFSLLISLLLVYVFSQIMSESSFFSEIPLGQKYAKSSLTADQKYSILNRLEDFMDKEKYYLSNNASLTDLAEKLNTSPHNLSQVLNENKHSFFDVLSAYRMRAACKLLKDPAYQQHKVEQIANEVGYNSKSAFNTAFKKHTGLTPSQYKASKDVLTYGDVHLAQRKIPEIPRGSRTFGHVKITIAMINNFYKIFVRHVMRNKLFSIINLFGLTLGFGSCMLMYLFVQDELSYDTTLPEHDQIYRLFWQTEQPQTRTPHPMAQALYRDFPDVVAAVSISPWYGPGLTKQTVNIRNVGDDIVFDEPDFYFADTTFFDVFDFKIIRGDRNTALKTIGGIVITASIAEKYFGNQNPIGKTLNVGDDRRGLTVTAVVEDPPKNAHFHFNFLFSYASIKTLDPNSHWMTWADFGHFNYMKLAKHADVAGLEDKIQDWSLKYFDWPDHAVQRLLDREVMFRLQPIADIHLKSHLKWELETNGNILYVYIISGTIIFILLIVAINYINLTTAKSLERAKEIGVKKTLGALRGQLSIQFLMESIMYCILAMVLAFLLVSLVLSEFNNLSNKTFQLTDIFDLNLLLLGFCTAVIIGFASGVYPAVLLSSFKPNDILKGKFSASGSGQRIRSFLIVIQFIVSAALISSSLIILRQINYLQGKELGFEENYVVSVPIRSTQFLEKINVIKSELASQDGIISVSALSNVPGGQFNQNPIFTEENPDVMIDASEWRIDYEVFDVLGIELTDGRLFDKTHALDSAGKTFIVNEAAVQYLGLNNAVGTKIIWMDNEITREGNIVGVVKDFHYKSLHTTIRPLIVQIYPEDFNELIIKIDNNNIGNSLSAIESVYNKFETQYDFSYSFLDQEIESLYQAEVKTLGVFGIFAIIALLLACLGLLGMAITILNQRIKEVGIRKILGANPIQIITMITRSFLRLIIIALFLGLPISYLAMQEWLSEFPYQVTIGATPFIFSSLVLLFVSLCSVSYIVIKIAYSNPAMALRYE